MENKNQSELNKKILEAIQDNVYSVDNIICKHSVKGEEKASNAIERIVIQEQIDLLNRLYSEVPTGSIERELQSLINQLNETK